MARILLHLGLHKTGTSSMQHLLYLNRALLEPHLDFLLVRPLKAAARHCLAFSRSGDPLHLSALTKALETIVAAQPELGQRDLILSSENLSGVMPGWEGNDGYAALPGLSAHLAAFFADRFPTADLNLVFSTRSSEDWLASLWCHQVRWRRMTLDFDDFAMQNRQGADLESIVSAVAKKLDPFAVFALPLEESQHHPKGPGGALLELIDLPAAVRDAIAPVGRGNPRPEETLNTRFLAMNRSDVTDTELYYHKVILAKRANIRAWVPALAGPQAD
jgi:hypothetical protein